MADKKCVATPGPRFEMTVRSIDLPDVFEPSAPRVGGLFGALMPDQYGVFFPRYDLPLALGNSYPELLDKKVPPGTQKAIPGYEPIRASSYNPPTIFYANDTPAARRRLADLFAECEHRRCPLDLLIRGIPATLVVRPLRYSCYCSGTLNRGVKLELLAVRLDPHSMGLPTYQDFLAEEDKDHEERTLEGGHDYY